MFTGLVESVGEVVATRGTSTGIELCMSHALGELMLGESIAVNGCCLTVVKAESAGARGSAQGRFWVEVTHDSLARTTLARLRAQGRANLERSLRVGDRLGGHLVTGHVDAVARVLELEKLGEDCRLRCAMPDGLWGMLAPQGSVTLDGVSLTLGPVSAAIFGVTLIPHTQAVTTLGELRPGSLVNVEVDVLARYVAHALSVAGSRGEAVDNAAPSPLITSLKKAGLL